MLGKTISLYLVNGNPNGIICTYLSNWTGQAIKIPRNLLEDARSRSEVIRIGIYFLFGYSEENPEEQIVYIGEADNIFNRLVQHTKDEEKLFWSEAIAFTSKDDNLTKGHIKYLEYKLIKIGDENPNYILHNKKNEKQPSLPEMAISDMEEFLKNITLVLPTLGYDLLESPREEIKISKSKKDEILKLRLKNNEAYGTYSSNGFIVFKGSKINREIQTSLSNGYRNLREKLILNEVIDEKKLEFKKDYEFKSPSAAAATILGYAINGRENWVDSRGKTLKQYEEERLN
ncbi:MAG: GIY-YIG nuclease family protein [Fusobacteriaceae bacterium]|nr:GIY-YIG nuclease family protein [Fusobacteriaceae bacterium]MBN2837584.1 GIY-YIG nuclease family protein [Fusobacteriaceae bacterium]